MNRDVPTGPTFDAWLKSELDAVPKPDRAIQDAVAALGRTPQRVPLALRLKRILGLSPTPAPTDGLPPPETVLWADTSTRTGTSGLAPAISERRGLPLPLTIMAVAIAAVIGFGALFLTIGPGGAWLGGASGPGASATPLRPLPPPVDGGRRIAVALDGSGHFTSISDAVAFAEPGDRVVVAPGTYVDRVFIDKAISVEGEGGRDRVIVRADGTPSADGSVSVFVLENADATISGLTVMGAKIGQAITVDGGSPVMNDLVIDAAGDQVFSNPTDPREGVSFDNDTTATLQNSLVKAFIEVAGGTPTIDGNTFTSDCIRSHGPSAKPTISNNIMRDSTCPNFTIAVSGGSNAVLAFNNIATTLDDDVIRVMGEGSFADIRSQVIRGGVYGVWIGPGASANLRRSLITETQRAVGVVGGEAVVDSMEIMYNETGVFIDDGSAPNLVNNRICDNGIDVDQRSEPPVSLETNTIGVCPPDPETDAIEPTAMSGGGET